MLFARVESSQRNACHFAKAAMQEREEMGAPYRLEIMQLWYTRSGLTKADIGFLFNEFLLIYHRVDFNLLGMSRTKEINVLCFFLLDAAVYHFRDIKHQIWMKCSAGKTRTWT